MKLLVPQMPVSIYGATGTDAEGDFVLSQFERYGVDAQGVIRRGETAFTDVYEETSTNCRTFFYSGGANDSFDVKDIDYGALHCRILQVCYPLLLKTLDQPDAQYGSRMGILLYRAQQAGCMTALDVVSEDSERYKTIVRPLLRYTAHGYDCENTFIITDVLLTPAAHNQDVLDAVVTRLPETLFLTHHVYPQVLAYQPEDHGDPLTQPVESNEKWLNDQLEAAFWSDDACCEVSRCGSIICRRVAGDA